MKIFPNTPKSNLLSAAIFVSVIVCMYIVSIFSYRVFSPTPVQAASVDVSQYGPSTLYSGLVGWWTFNTNYKGSFLDMSGQSAPMKIMAGATTTVRGMNGSAISLLGGASGYAIASSTALDFGGSAMTVSTWLYPTVTLSGNNRPALAEREGCGTNMNFQLYANESSSNGPYFNITNGVTVYAISPGSAYQLKLNKWQLLTGVYDGSFVRLYLNGVSIGTPTAAPATMNGVMNRFWIGNDSCANAYTGYMDDIRLYNRALSANEIRLLYTSSLGGNMAVSTVGPANLGGGLIGWWTFDGKDSQSGKVTDRSGYSLPSSPINISSSTFYVPGKIGQAVTFDGVASYMTQQTSSVTALTQITGSFWMKSVDQPDPTYLQGIISKGSPNGAEDFAVSLGSAGISPNKLVLSFNTDLGSSGNISSTMNLNDGNWHHIAWTWDSVSDNWFLYVDGVQNNSGNVIGNTLSNTDSEIRFGTFKNPGVGGTYWQGTLDEVRFYNRVLSAQEIYQLYNTGSEKFAVTQIGANNLNSGLVSWWTLDAKAINWKTGTVLNSVSGGANGSVVKIATSSAVAGKLGQAIWFSRSNQNGYISIGAGPSSVSTISFWMKAATSTNQQIMSLNSTQFITASSTSGNILRTNGFTGTTIVYVDGKLASSTDTNWHQVTITTTGAINASAMNIGLVGTAAFGGTLDDIRLYNRVLSAQEAAQLYYMGK